MTTSASDSNAVSDKTKHDQAKPPRHCICARFKDTRHKCAYDFEDLGIIGEFIAMSSLMLWQFVSLNLKFMLSEKATKIDEIFTVYLTLST